MKQETKTCQNCEKEFAIEPEDFEFYDKIKVPAPTFCPECRLVRRMQFRNLKTLYKRKVLYRDEEVLSMFAPDSPFKVVDEKFFWSDKWDAMEYGRDYDFSKPFFEQLKELLLEIPWPHRFVIDAINSEYCNNAGPIKNCYWVFNTGNSENVLYGIDVIGSNDCVDVDKIQNCELCYELFDSGRCNRVFFYSGCGDCYNIYFSHNLINCHDCLGCVNLAHKSYHIFNKPYSKDEYFKKLKEFEIGSYQNVLKFKKELQEFQLKFPKKYIHGHSNVNVSGDYLEHCKNVKQSFICQNLENCAYCQLILFIPSKDSFDITVAGGELCYEIEETVGYNLKFCWFDFPLKFAGRDVSNIEYTIASSASSFLFGCVGLRHKQYCILNKQYTKEEYERLVPKIIEQMNEMPYISKIQNSNLKNQNDPGSINLWFNYGAGNSKLKNEENLKTKEIIYKYGEFFPPELSPFAYNETIAQEYFPLTKEEAITKGYRWKDPEPRNYQITMKTEALPDNIKDVPDSITQEIIQCGHTELQLGNAVSKCNEQCTTAFKIIPQELQFYRRMNLPLPRLCPNCRHYERIKQRNPLKLWHRQCQCGGVSSDNGVYQNTIEHFHKSEHCPNEFETTYSPERREIVYCEKCYQAEVV